MSVAPLVRVPRLARPISLFDRNGPTQPEHPRADRRTTLVESEYRWFTQPAGNGDDELGRMDRQEREATRILGQLNSSFGFGIVSCFIQSILFCLMNRVLCIEGNFS